MRPSRLLVLASYPEMGAATRFRACAYFPALRAGGVEPELHPFMDEAFMRDFYRPGHSLGKAAGIARFALRRLALLLRARSFDAVLVQREAAIVGPAVIEGLLARRFRLPMVLDVDDAIWTGSHEASRHPLASRLLRNPDKTIGLLKMAAHVVTGNHFLADFASRYNARVTVVPTVVSADLWRPLPGRLDGALVPGRALPVIGWIGTHSTARQLDLVAPALAQLAREGHRFRVRLVGASRDLHVPGVQVESVPWSRDTEIADFQDLDVGIAPMFDDAWSLGKCGFKQIQYMAVGVPLVSSPGGGAREFMEHDVHGLFAVEPGDWVTHLRALLTDAALRARLARAGRALIEGRLSLERQAPTLVDLIRRVVAGAGVDRTHDGPRTRAPAEQAWRT